MKIAFYSARASHLKPGASGDQVFVARLLEGLRGRGHQIELVSKVGIYDFWRGRLPARRLLTEAISTRRRMRRFAPDAWLTYGTSAAYPDPFGWWQRPARYVLLNTSKGDLERLRRPWRPAFAFAHRRSIASADAVLAAWPRNAERLRKLAAAPERLGVLPAAVETWDRLPSPEAARRRFGLPAEAPVILCLARLPGPRADGRPWKTDWVLDLLEEIAATPLPDEAILLHAGDGPGLERVAERAAAADLGGRVRLAGAVAHESIGWLYAACDLFAYVSSSDRPWHAALEAQACGRPVVTMRTSASEMTVEHGVTGLLAGSRAELRVQIATLAADRPRCAAMGRAASAYVRRRHSIEARVRQVEELLQTTTATTNGKDGR